MSKNITVFQDGFDSSVFTKDVGLIPIVFKRDLNYNCNFLCYWIKEPEEILKKNNIQVTIIDREETITATLRNTDILILYGIYDYNLDMIKKYKAIRPEGKIYLKLDMNIHWLRRIDMNENLISLLKCCTLISVECRNLYSYIKEHWPLRVEYIPNGYYNLDDSNVSYAEKENTIITVGRLGTYEKSTETLLQAFKLAYPRLGNWKLRLIGSIEESFKGYIEEFFKVNPELKDKVIFTDKITDRKLLEKEYERAKIFCLTSRFEGFPNVFPESTIKGCYIISSDIDPAYDITDNRRYGSIFPIDNSEELSRILVDVCSKEELIKEVSSKIQAYARKNFNWISLCRRIEYYLEMPSNFYKLAPLMLDRATMESPSSILDLCRYPMGNALLTEGSLVNSRNDLIIDRIDTDGNSTSSVYSHIYTGDVFDNLDNLPSYDVILVSNMLEYLEKSKGFLFIDKLLLHTNKKLVIASPKSCDDKYPSRWSYIDFYKYNFSSNSVTINDEEILIFSFFPPNNQVNDTDSLYMDFKQGNKEEANNSNKLNIAYILPHRTVTGGLKVLIKQMNLLKARGHRVTGLLQGDYTGGIFPDTNKIEIDKEIIVGRNEILEDYLQGYDVIVTGFINDWININNTKLPVILFEQGYETLFGEFKRYNAYIEKNNKLYFDSIYSSRQSLIVSVSRVLSDILRFRYGRLSETIPNGIDTDLYFPINKVENNTTKLLLIGSPYLDFKGFDFAIRVLKRLTDLSYKLEITWICQERPYFHVPLNVNYVVNPPEELLAKTIRENDILLSTSWYESFALPPLEAMASGVAVVSTDNGGIKTYGKHDYNCLLVEPGDTNGLLASLINLILDTNKRNKLISNGLKTAEEFNIESMINQWENMLRNVSRFYNSSDNQPETLS